MTTAGETTLAPVVAQSLSTAMRQGSMAEHRDAEGSTFMTELLAGQLNHTAYTDYLLRLRTVYAALETSVTAQSDHPLVEAVHDPALERLAAIDADLAHWAPGHVNNEHVVDSPAAVAYQDRIVESGASWAGALVAHHYTRYLGDLSGGQAIGRILDRTFELDGAGVAFYSFTAIPKPKPYKDGYRARLDALELTPSDAARVVDEVKIAFGLNQALFTELGERIETYRT